jgi:DNA-binding NarL/FixJ family response regulator
MVPDLHIGLVSDAPMRLAGLASIFDPAVLDGKVALLSFFGNTTELLTLPALDYLVLDLHESSGGSEILLDIRRLAHPGLRVIVVGPQGNDELAIEAILAGAKAYLDTTADLDLMRSAIGAVASGSIWAPHSLLSKLVDRLLKDSDSSLSNAPLQLTAREKQVMEQILLARSNREIARQLGIRERTVKGYVGQLMRKTGVDSRIDLCMRVLNRQVVQQTRPETAHSERPIGRFTSD